MINGKYAKFHYDDLVLKYFASYSNDPFDATIFYKNINEITNILNNFHWGGVDQKYTIRKIKISIEFRDS